MDERIVTVHQLNYVAPVEESDAKGENSNSDFVIFLLIIIGAGGIVMALVIVSLPKKESKDLQAVKNINDARKQSTENLNKIRNKSSSQQKKAPVSRYSLDAYISAINQRKISDKTTYKEYLKSMYVPYTKYDSVYIGDFMEDLFSNAESTILTKIGKLDDHKINESDFFFCILKNFF